MVAKNCTPNVFKAFMTMFECHQKARAYGVSIPKLTTQGMKGGVVIKRILLESEQKNINDFLASRAAFLAVITPFV